MSAPSPSTLRELRDSGHRLKSVKAEIRDNLLSRLAAGEPAFPGILGFDETVLPEVERALLAGHDMVLLGERGQGKTRLIRTIVGLLDEWTPVIAGAELHEHPYEPITPASKRLAAELGDELPVAWVHRDERYAEKLATPDTSVGDLIGDVDPIKVAEGRTLGDPETVHYGLVPHQPRDLQRQRAARPGRADPGGTAQRARGARHPDPRLPGAAAAGPAAGREREPRGLHQPRADHHP